MSERKMICFRHGPAVLVDLLVPVSLDVVFVCALWRFQQQRSVLLLENLLVIRRSETDKSHHQQREDPPMAVMERSRLVRLLGVKP
jgi:hypothetical protein